MRFTFGLIFVFAAIGAVAAQDGRPAAQPAKIDWKMAGRDAAALSSDLRTEAGPPLGAEKSRRIAESFQQYAEQDGTLALARLNEIVSEGFQDVSKSRVPVLLPFDSTKFVKDRVDTSKALKKGAEKSAQSYVAGNGRENAALVVGPSGYDAFISVSPAAVSSLKSGKSGSVTVHVSASAYTRDEGGDQGEPVPELQSLYPDLRRFPTDSDVSFVFKKYGVPYVVTVPCSDQPLRGSGLSCKAADKVAGYVISKLQIAGGAPLSAPPQPRTEKMQTAPTGTIAPANCSTAQTQPFSYYPAGKLMPGSDVNSLGGVKNPIVYSDTFRFPAADCPAFANSQVFMHWGACLDKEQKLPAPKPGEPDFSDRYKSFGRYHCKQNDKRLWRVEGYPENYSYPWRDNFCESRPGRKTAACPGGIGHQGQDIRINRCELKGDRCKPGLFDVVAVEDGSALTLQGDSNNQITLTVDKGNGDKMYYLYLHTTRESQASNGLVPGKPLAVKRGQILAKAGNFLGKVNGTTTHLHFEARPQRYVPASPYMTLVRSYERLLGATGTEIAETSANAPH